MEANAQWPMSNDLDFDASVEYPAFSDTKSPTVLIDGGHHNFFIHENFIEPFKKLIENDGFDVIMGDQEFSADYLERFQIVVIITALPFDFGSEIEVTDQITFKSDEIEALFEWTSKGGSLLVFSEHAPFDQAINPLLNRFGINSSVGYIADDVYNMKNGRPGWIEFTRENGLLDVEHPIINGRFKSERIDNLVTFRGSALEGPGYTNLFQLSKYAKNVQDPTGVGPIGTGNSQALAGDIGNGKIMAFGDSNGFTAMAISIDNNPTFYSGMNLEGYDWKQFVLNVMHWLAGILD